MTLRRFEAGLGVPSSVSSSSLSMVEVVEDLELASGGARLYPQTCQLS